jgi:hypothetical protein
MCQKPKLKFKKPEYKLKAMEVKSQRQKSIKKTKNYIIMFKY